MQTFLRIVWLQSYTCSSMLCHNIRFYTPVIWCNLLVALVATQNPGCSGRDWWLVERLRRHPFDLVSQHPEWPVSGMYPCQVCQVHEYSVSMDFLGKPCISQLVSIPAPTWLKSSSSTSKRRASTRQRTFCKTASPQILQCGECKGVKNEEYNWPMDMWLELNFISPIQIYIYILAVYNFDQPQSTPGRYRHTGFPSEIWMDLTCWEKPAAIDQRGP